MAFKVGTPSAGDDGVNKSTFDDFTDKFEYGRAPFESATTAAITFAEEYDDTNYCVLLTPDAEVGTWITNKATTGFTINTSAAHTGDVSWLAVKD